MWCTSAPPASARRPETRWSCHLSRCPGFGVHLSGRWRAAGASGATCWQCVVRRDLLPRFPHPCHDPGAPRPSVGGSGGERSTVRPHAPTQLSCARYVTGPACPGGSRGHPVRGSLPTHQQPLAVHRIACASERPRTAVGQCCASAGSPDYGSLRGTCRWSQVGEPRTQRPSHELIPTWIV